METIPFKKLPRLFLAEHNVWINMKARCYNAKTTGFQYWGGRGIKVCERWVGSFRNFLLDMGRKPSPKHSIDRINNDGDYEPSNCRWVERKVQNRNRRGRRYLTFQGKTLTFAEWSDVTGIPQGTIFDRTAGGWSVERTLTSQLGATRKDAVLISYAGRILTISQWSKETGLPKSTIESRLLAGWSVHDVIHVPRKAFPLK